MNAPVTVLATIRGRAALDEVRALFDQLYLIDSDIAEFDNWESKSGPLLDAPFRLTYDEVHRVLVERRDAVLTKLENKGIRIAPDSVPVAAAVYDNTIPAAPEKD